MSKAYYNGMLLPEIPQEYLLEYPYFTILVFKTNKDFIALFCSKHIPYYTNETLQLRDDVLRLEHRNEEWVEVASEGNYAGFNYWDIIWTSYNVPNGSETATSIYYYGNEPVLYPYEEIIKQESNRYSYNGEVLPKLPRDALLNYPCAWIRKNVGSGYYDLLLAKGLWFQPSSGFINHNDSNQVQWYRLSLTAPENANEWAFYQAISSNNWGDNENNYIIWANHNVPIKSATASDIYFWGSEPVPYPDLVFEDYTIKRESLTAIADAIRGKTGKTESLTVEQMVAEIGGISGGSGGSVVEELPSAEEAAFGIATAGEEYGIVINDTSKIGRYNYSGDVVVYQEYTVKEAFSLVGVRIYSVTASNASRDLEININAELKTTTQLAYNKAVVGWNKLYFDSPIKVAVGDVIQIYEQYEEMPRNISLSYATVNPKVEIKNGFMGGFSGTTAVYGIFDVIIAPVQDELPDTYQIERTTMDDIAEEVQRITGTEYKMSTTQIIDALQGIDNSGGGETTIPENARLYYVGSADSAFDLSNLRFNSSVDGTTEV